MIAGWKLLREAERVGLQIRSYHWRFLGQLARRRYDRLRPSRVSVRQGALAAGTEMAVLLIYQPGGVERSTLFTLDWLARQGVSPVVVSNAPLSQNDGEALASRCHLVIERPNIGYDFGGYREGILSILDRGYEPEALYVLNDSIWFPLDEDCDAIRRSRESDADIFGLHTSWLSNRRSGVEYLQSYFFRFSAKVVRSGIFTSFWRKMGLMDNKYMVVRAFERGVTSRLAKAGFTIDSAIHWRAVIDCLMNIDDEALLDEIIRFQCATNRKDAETLQPLLDSGMSAMDVRASVEPQIRARRLFVTMVALHPALLHRIGVPFLKKARTPDMAAQRAVLISQGLHRGFHAAIREEVERRDSA